METMAVKLRETKVRQSKVLVFFLHWNKNSLLFSFCLTVLVQDLIED